ncbi:response regulator [Candidatus Pacearchaeota archaeon]|nr:response regulator [Candidatus Pacearchaeota archaeon]
MGGKKTIVLVDDDIMVRDVFSRFLTGKGYDVQTAANGEDALTKIEKIDSGVYGIISDIDMPILNGIEMAKRLEEKGKKYPIVFMSGDYPGKIEYFGKKLKPLKKPIALGDLEKAVEKTFG